MRASPGGGLIGPAVVQRCCSVRAVFRDPPRRAWRTGVAGFAGRQQGCRDCETRSDDFIGGRPCGSASFIQFNVHQIAPAVAHSHALSSGLFLNGDPDAFAMVSLIGLEKRGHHRRLAYGKCRIDRPTDRFNLPRRSRHAGGKFGRDQAGLALVLPDGRRVVLRRDGARSSTVPAGTVGGRRLTQDQKFDGSPLPSPCSPRFLRWPFDRGFFAIAWPAVSAAHVAGPTGADRSRSYPTENPAADPRNDTHKSHVGRMADLPGRSSTRIDGHAAGRSTMILARSWTACATWSRSGWLQVSLVKNVRLTFARPSC